jgi:hypothetical protein
VPDGVNGLFFVNKEKYQKKHFAAKLRFAFALPGKIPGGCKGKAQLCRKNSF